MSQLPLDPYLTWAQSSEFRGYKELPRPKGGARLLPLAIELRPGAKVQDLLGVAAVPKAYLNLQTAFVSATVPENKLGDLVKMVKLVKRFKLGLPSTPSTHLPSGEGISPLSDLQIPVLAFIDHGIGFLNRRFWTANGRSRMLCLWDQEDTGSGDPRDSKPWQTPNDFAYGRELSRASLEKWRAGAGKDATEHEAYRRLNYSPCAGRRAHGTHVMDLACGDLAGGRTGAPPDLASMLPIIAVQLPWKPFKDTSSSSLCVHLLDGLRYIMGRVGKARPVIVNISDGAYAGSHDGNSLLECAIDDLLDEYPKLTVVIAAGNGYQQKLHGKWSGASTAPPLKWRVLPDSKTDSFLEIWCRKKNKAFITVTSPAGRAVTVKLGDSQALFGYDKQTQIGGVYSSKDATPNESDRAMFLVALAPTRPKIETHPAAPHGVWTIEVNGTGGFDAYIQRSNPALGDTGPLRQSYFIDDRKEPRYVTGEGTLNNIATGERPIVVGGYYLRGHWFDPDTGKKSRIARYSSVGPGRKGVLQDVNVLAPSEDSPVLHGLLACGVRSGTMVRMDGTSVAAPIITRLIANNLGRNLTDTNGSVYASP